MDSKDPTFHQRLLDSFEVNPPHVRGFMPYREYLVGLSLVIQSDLPRIQETFPEYTPHDWNQHVIPLFDIAARLFSERGILGLSSIDRFMFVAGIYAHDWGMAIQSEEREAIAAGGRGEALLPDEARQLSLFAQQTGIRADRGGKYPVLLDDSSSLWPEYVRRTHAWRSARQPPVTTPAFSGIPLIVVSAIWRCARTIYAN